MSSATERWTFLLRQDSGGQVSVLLRLSSVVCLLSSVFRPPSSVFYFLTVLRRPSSYFSFQPKAFGGRPASPADFSAFRFFLQPLNVSSFLSVFSVSGFQSSP